MNVAYRIHLFIITLTGLVAATTTTNINGEIDSTVSFPCEIDRLPANAIITWVYRPKNHKFNGIRWLPLYANARRLTQHNQRFIVDYSGYNEPTRTYSSALTIHQLRSSDEGIYMCKSNQQQSPARLFNLTVTPSIRILPRDGVLELAHGQRSANLSCTVREVSINPVDAARLQWFHNGRELHSIPAVPNLLHQNQATRTVHVHHLARNDSGLFECVYDNGRASKDVRLVQHRSSMLGLSTSSARRAFAWWWWPVVAVLIVSAIVR